MTQIPTIANMITAAGTTLAGRSGSPPQTILSVGIVLSDGRVAWGDCLAADDEDLPNSPPPFQADQAQTSIESVVLPALQGEPLDQFRRLAANLSALTETVMVTETLPYPEPAPVENQARRALLRGRLRPPDPSELGPPPTREVAVSRPLHPAVRYGVSQALLAAVALAQGKPMVALIRQEYELSLPAEPVPIHAETITANRMIVNRLLQHPIASLGYQVKAQDPAVELGKNAEILRRFVPNLQKCIVQSTRAAEPPILHVDLRGNLDRLYESNMGKILGVLVGLNLVIKPVVMRFENILIGDEGLDKQLDKMFEFRKYMTYRRLSTETVANAWIDSVEDVKTQVRRKGADMIHLNMARFGGIDQTIEALLVCKNQSFPVMLGGSPFETVRSAQIACHIAIATQPDLLVAKHSSGDDGGIVLMQNEMARILTELKYNHKE